MGTGRSNTQSCARHLRYPPLNIRTVARNEANQAPCELTSTKDIQQYFYLKRDSGGYPLYVHFAFFPDPDIRLNGDGRMNIPVSNTKKPLGIEISKSKMSSSNNSAKIFIEVYYSTVKLHISDGLPTSNPNSNYWGDFELEYQLS